MENSSAQPAADDGYPSPASAWYVVAILTVAYVIAFLDRQVLALLIDPIRADLGISDTQVSLLIGLAFALFYTILGVPIGWLADRKSRRGIIAIGVTLWCLMTAACGLARNFTQLFLARVGVGVGEATLNPAALSMISDLFPRDRRARPLAVFSMGVSVGAGVAFILGGQIIAWVFSADPLVLPVVGELKPWQTVFILVGLPGLLVPLMMLTVTEPSRKEKVDKQEASIADTIRYLKERRKLFTTHFLGLSIITICGYAYFSWIPTMFIRTWEWSIADISLAYGLVLLIVGPAGVTACGWFIDRWYRAGKKDAQMRMATVGCFILVPASIAVPLMPTPELAIAMLIPATVGGALPTAASAAALMTVVPNEFRAQVTAMYYFVISILGLTVGPTAVAFVTDYVFGDPMALRYSIAIVTGVAGVIAIGILLINLPLYRQAVIDTEASLKAG